MRVDRLEQVFLTPKGGRFEVLLVLESEAGARERVTLLTPTLGVAPHDRLTAARFVARWLAQRGGGLAPMLRVRCRRGAELEDDAAARAALLAELERLTGAA